MESVWLAVISTIALVTDAEHVWLMNSSTGPSPSDVFALSQRSSLQLNSTVNVQPPYSSFTNRRSGAPSVGSSKGQVYSLSGQSISQAALTPWSPHRRLSVAPYGEILGRRPRKTRKMRALPYQKCHQSQFLSLEQDTELLMQLIKAQITHCRD